MWKGLLKVILCVIHGNEQSFAAGTGGVASAFKALEVLHTHYWTQQPRAAETDAAAAAVFSAEAAQKRSGSLVSSVSL